MIKDKIFIHLQKIFKDMKRLLIPIVVIAFFSCSDKPQNVSGAFDITDSVQNVKSVTFDWKWSSEGMKSGLRDVEAEFTIDESKVTTVSEGGATVYSLINKTGIISDVYTYKGGKPDYDPSKRLWVVRYSGDATKVKVKWSGKLEQISGKGKSTVEVLFQVYGDWPAYSNNIRPQVEVDTLFLGLGLTEEARNDLREEARNRMIARYYNTSVDIAPPDDSPPPPPSSGEEEGEEEEEEDEEDEGEDPETPSLIINAEGEYFFPKPAYDEEEEDYEEDNGNAPLAPETVFRMQLFIRVSANDGSSGAQYVISDGLLEIEFE